VLKLKEVQLLKNASRDLADFPHSTASVTHFSKQKCVLCEPAKWNHAYFYSVSSCAYWAKDQAQPYSSHEPLYCAVKNVLNNVLCELKSFRKIILDLARIVPVSQSFHHCSFCGHLILSVNPPNNLNDSHKGPLSLSSLTSWQGQAFCY